MLTHLKTNTTVTVLDNRLSPISGLSDLPAFKMPFGSELIATRGIPAGLGFTFRFKDLYDITPFHYLQEGTVRYRVTGVNPYNTPLGAHIRVEAQMEAGT